ncbi:hypothetical protein K1719_016979 [Acacia pycnantha]|nr:hypothetical protein K1719_016979 [Acacia pycnantha]
MESGTNSSGRRHARAVHLNLSPLANVQKGRTLVGKLETDKNLNRGIVISMIKKGWGLDKDMEIHELQDNNAFLFRFPKQDDYTRILKARNCKFPSDTNEEDEAVNSVGNGLGTPHVKTLEDALVAHDQEWDEMVVIRARPPPAKEAPDDRRRNFALARNGKSQYNGEISAPQLLKRADVGTGQKGIKASVNAQIQKEVQIVEIPRIMEPMQKIDSLLSLPQSSSVQQAPPVSPPINVIHDNLGGSFSPHLFTYAEEGNGNMCSKASFNSDMQKEIQAPEIPTIRELITDIPFSFPQSPPSHQYPTVMSPPFTSQTLATRQPTAHHRPVPITHIATTSYRVEFPDHDTDPPTATLPVAGLSPISAVTSSFNRIHLKRSPDPQDELSMNPTKKRLLFLEPAPPPAPNQQHQNSSDKTQRVSCRRLKKTIRGSKGNRKVKPIGPTTSIDSTHISPPGTHPGTFHNNPLSLDSPNTADGCHQATIGSP